MTIVSADIIDVCNHYPRTIGRNAVRGPHGDGPTVTGVILRTSDGHDSWGLTAGQPTLDGVLGKHPSELLDPESRYIAPSAAWCELALWDLLGKLNEQPVYELLGSNGSGTVTLYDASIYFEDLDPEDSPRGLDVLLANTQSGWDAGFRAFKLKLGRGFTWMDEEAGYKRDVEVVHEIHQAFPGARLLVDVNNGYTVERTLRFLDAVSDVGLFWIEEPFHEHENGLERLRRWIDNHRANLLVADGEAHYNVKEMVRFARAGLVDVLLMDVQSFGITSWLKVSDSLQDTPTMVSPHAWGVPLKSLYASHMALGIPKIPCVEGVRGYADGVDTSNYSLHAGQLSVTDRPGFGIPLPAPAAHQ